MATKKSSRPGPLALPSRAEIMGASVVELMAGQMGDEEQAAIVRKTATDILRARAVGAKKRIGEQVVEQGALSTAHRLVGFAEAMETLRSRVQDEAVRQRIDQVLERIEQEHVNAQLRLGYGLEDQVEAIVGSSADPQTQREEEYIVEMPNLLQQIFGGQSKITRTRR